MTLPRLPDLSYNCSKIIQRNGPFYHDAKESQKTIARRMAIDAFTLLVVVIFVRWPFIDYPLNLNLRRFQNPPAHSTFQNAGIPNMGSVEFNLLNLSESHIAEHFSRFF